MAIFSRRWGIARTLERLASSRSRDDQPWRLRRRARDRRDPPAHSAIYERADCRDPARRPIELMGTDGRKQRSDHLGGKLVAAFAGIGNPAAFRKTLEDLGCDPDRIPSLRRSPPLHQGGCCRSAPMGEYAAGRRIDRDDAKRLRKAAHRGIGGSAALGRAHRTNVSRREGRLRCKIAFSDLKSSRAQNGPRKSNSGTRR